MKRGEASAVVTVLLDLVYPRTCVGCGGGVGTAPGHICWECRASLLVITPPFCARCGDPVDGRIDNDYTCSFCRKHPVHFDLARSAVRYRGITRLALHAMKYGGMTCLSADCLPLLGACVDAHYARVRFDAVAFVPLHPRRERERTYNQSRLLAGCLARQLRLPLLSRCLRRTRATLTQTHLSARERRLNVRGALATESDEWIEGRTLLLVDDVMTTGATVNECARVLKEAGAAGVYVVTVARG